MSLLLTIITCIILALIIIAALVMHYMGNILAEFNDHFLSLTAILLLFMIGAAVYLSYAMPTVASASVERNGDIKIYRDSPPQKSIIETFLGE